MKPTSVQKTIKFLLALAAFLAIGHLAACNTVEGAGEDIESVGESMQGK